MRYHYESGFENFKRAQRTFFRSTWLRRLRFHFFMWGATMLGVLIILVAASFGVEGPQGSIAASVGGGLLGLGIVSLVLRPWQLRRTYQSMNGKDKHLHVYLEVEGDVLVSGIAHRSEGRFQRSAICGTVEDDDMLLLFVTAKRFLYIPKRDIHEAGLAELRRWLALPGAPTKC